MTTTEVAKQLGLTYHALYRHVEKGHFPRPKRGSSWRYVWTPEDVERARAALAVNRRKK